MAPWTRHQYRQEPSQELSFMPVSTTDDAPSYADLYRHLEPASGDVPAVSRDQHTFPSQKENSRTGVVFQSQRGEHASDSMSVRSRHTRISAIGAWVWEIVSLLVAIGLLVAMFIILAKQNDMPVDDWTFVINLNSLIALLSTIYRAALVVIAAEIISQEKWSVFWSSKSPQPLQNFKRFDAASRSIWGAVRILSIAVRHSPSASMCAVIILVSFAVGPFTQQAIGTINKEHYLEQPNPPSLPVARQVADTNLSFVNVKGYLFGGRDLTADAQTSMFTAFLNPRSNDLKIDANCTTGNCIFPSLLTGSLLHDECEVTHNTAGMCSSCFDVSSLIQNNTSTGRSGSYLLPDGTNSTTIIGPSDSRPLLSVNSPDNLDWARSVIPAANLTQLRLATVNVTILTFGPATEAERELGEVSKPIAVACSLYPCLRSYCGRVSDGSFSEDLVHSEPMYPDFKNPRFLNETISDLDHYGAFGVENLAAVPPSCLLNDTVYTASNYSTYFNTTEIQLISPANAPDYPSAKVPEECVYRYDSFLQSLTTAYFTERVFQGSCNAGNSISCYDQYWLAQFYNNDDASFGAIREVFSNFAEAMTKQYRLGLGSPEDSANSMSGVAIDMVTFNVIEWKWLIFPLALLVIEAAALLWIITRTIRYRGEEMVWKSNPLPVFYHRDRFVDAYGMKLRDLDGPLQDEGSAMQLLTIREMERDAKKVKVQLLRGTRWTKTDDEDGKSWQRVTRVRDMDSDSLMETQ